ncbi:MAG: 2-oxoacid:acceptor oxidoreductase family protein [Bacteriovoracaceae bacterium]|nr:2-oxoacid:acceptor oxidoreductase family protein [Bacteriovoracaceae bacterium]
MGNIISKPKSFCDDFVRKPGNYPKVTHYCPGCGHGRVHKLIAEALDDHEMKDNTMFVSPVGCSVFGYYYFDVGNFQAAHGRAPAVATAAARSNPHGYTISYQGDGDLAAIGTAEIIHAANRGEDMTVIFVNNTIYGMTGGQMAPTTLEGQKTTTSPYGRDLQEMGNPIRMAEIIAQLDAPVFVERVAVSDSKHIRKARTAIRKALKSQKDRQGFSFVEILATCPIGWKMTPVDAIKRLEEEVIPYFPLANFKDDTDDRPAKLQKTGIVKAEDIIRVLGVDKDERIFPLDENFINNFPNQNIKVAGFGGQGVLMAGTTLGSLGMELGLKTTWLPSYGPEMRGGTANCNVCISKDEIGSPIVESPDVLIAMNEPSMHNFGPEVKKGGLIIANSSVIQNAYKRDDVTIINVPMTEIADECGVKAAANMAAVTAYMSYTGVIDLETLKTLIKTNFKKKNLIDKNIEVIEAAEKYIVENYKK